jgi:hypothetical protein
MMRHIATALAIATLLSACGGGGSSPTPAPPPAEPPAPVFSFVQPTGARIGGNPMRLSVTNVSSSASVQWSLAAGTPGQLAAIDNGSLSGTEINYVPPQLGGAAPVLLTVSATIGKWTESMSFTLGPAVKLELLASKITPATPALPYFASRMAMTPSGSLLVATKGIVTIAADGTIGRIADEPNKDIPYYMGIVLDGTGQLLATTGGGTIYKVSEGSRKALS